MEEERERKPLNRTPLYLGMSTLLITCVLLFYTEAFYDISVQLNKTLLYILWTVTLANTLNIFTEHKKASTALAIITFVATIGIDSVLFARRNQVTRIYLPNGEINEGQLDKISKLLNKSRVVLIAGPEPEKLPEKLKKLTKMNEKEKKRLKNRIKSANVNDKKEYVEIIDEDGIDGRRFSGIKSILVIPIKNKIVNEENYEDLDFDKWV